MKIKMFLIVVFQCFMLIGQGAFCEEEKGFMSEKATTEFYNDYKASQGDDGSMPKMVMKMVLSLSVVLFVMVLILFILKKYFPGTLTVSDQNLKLMKIMEKMTLGPKQNIYLIWAVDRILVLSHQNNQISYLTEIKDENVIQEKVPDEFSDVLTHSNLKIADIYNAG